MTTVCTHIALAHYTCDSTQLKIFVDFEVKLFRGCNGVRCLLGMVYVYIVSLDIYCHIHFVCILYIDGKKRGMWSKGKILE